MRGYRLWKLYTRSRKIIIVCNVFFSPYGNVLPLMGYAVLHSNGNSTSKIAIWGLVFTLTNIRQLRRLVLSCSHTGKLLVGALRIPLWTSFLFPREPNKSNLPPQVLKGRQGELPQHCTIYSGSPQSSLEFGGVPPSFFHINLTSVKKWKFPQPVQHFKDLQCSRIMFFRQWLILVTHTPTMQNPRVSSSDNASWIFMRQGLISASWIGQKWVSSRCKTPYISLTRW